MYGFLAVSRTNLAILMSVIYCLVNILCTLDSPWHFLCDVFYKTILTRLLRIVEIEMQSIRPKTLEISVSLRRPNKTISTGLYLQRLVCSKCD